VGRFCFDKGERESYSVIVGTAKVIAALNAHQLAMMAGEGLAAVRTDLLQMNLLKMDRPILNGCGCKFPVKIGI
jgi:hypothetical protein